MITRAGGGELVPERHVLEPEPPRRRGRRGQGRRCPPPRVALVRRRGRHPLTRARTVPGPRRPRSARWRISTRTYREGRQTRAPRAPPAAHVPVALRDAASTSGTGSRPDARRGCARAQGSVAAYVRRARELADPRPFERAGDAPAIAVDSNAPAATSATSSAPRARRACGRSTASSSAPPPARQPRRRRRRSASTRAPPAERISKASAVSTIAEDVRP